MEKIPVEKNKEYIVEIIDNGFEGEGIAKIDNFTIFINGAIKGEKVKILIVKVLSSHAFGKIVEILEKTDVRHVFDKAVGNLGTSGCVSYLFNKKGVIVIERASTEMSEDDVMMLALDAGAEDFSADEEVYEITTEPSDFTQVSEKLEEAGLEFLEAGVQMVPTTTVQLDEKGVEKMERLIERLDELDDVANIYHNWEE